MTTVRTLALWGGRYLLIGAGFALILRAEFGLGGGWLALVLVAWPAVAVCLSALFAVALVLVLLSAGLA